MSKKIHLVYYSYIGGVEPFPDGKYFWKDVILGQLKDIKNSGILEASSFCLNFNLIFNDSISLESFSGFNEPIFEFNILISYSNTRTSSNKS